MGAWRLESVGGCFLAHVERKFIPFILQLERNEFRSNSEAGFAGP